MSTALELRPQVIETVNTLRRLGYKVGVVSEGCFIAAEIIRRRIFAAEIIRRRIFADFALANTMLFEGSVCQGEARLNRAYQRNGRDAGCNKHQYCSSNLLGHLRLGERDIALRHILAGGSGANDRCLLRSADYAFVLDSCSEELLDEPGVTQLRSIAELVNCIAAINEDVATA